MFVQVKGESCCGLVCTKFARFFDLDPANNPMQYTHPEAYLVVREKAIATLLMLVMEATHSDADCLLPEARIHA